MSSIVACGCVEVRVVVGSGCIEVSVVVGSGCVEVRVVVVTGGVQQVCTVETVRRRCGSIETMEGVSRASMSEVQGWR